ncbi:MAG: VWA domain-containing protein, partial [Actinomycetota bacterium]|nr:VWA domain-containing protein [Actinomycetota bacterium]
EVPISASITFFQSLAYVTIANRDDVYWAGRSTLVRSPEDIPAYDDAFHAFWVDYIVLGEEKTQIIKEMTLAIDNDNYENDDLTDTSQEGELITLKYSPSELLRKKDFANYNDDELSEAYELMKSIRLIGSTQKSRRVSSVARHNKTPDLRGIIRASFRTAGEPIERYFMQKNDKSRRIVFLLDVSGSMEVYARALLRFIQVAIISRRRVEAFTIGTRLTRVTHELSNRDLDKAMHITSESITDWSGGTRLGETIREFLNLWGQRGMARGATVVILSDGWDRGKSEVMDEQMARLKRIAHNIIWINPLKVSPGYEPLAQGMAAALPYIDEFIEGHSLESLIELAEILRE